MANLGIINKNPLNIRYSSAINWKGQTGQNLGFAVFKSMEYGYRAAIKNLQSYIGSGTDTISKIINRWAPASDGNNPESYINNVVLRTGINKDKKIDKNDLNTLQALILAMSISEIGTNFPDAAQSAIKMIAAEQGIPITGLSIDNIQKNKGLIPMILILGAAGLAAYFILKPKS